ARELRADAQIPAAAQRELHHALHMILEHRPRVEEVAVIPESADRAVHVEALEQRALLAVPGVSIEHVRLHVPGTRHETVVGTEAWSDAEDVVVEAEAARRAVEDSFPQRAAGGNAARRRRALLELELREVQLVEDNVRVSAVHTVRPSAAHALAVQQAGVRLKVEALAHAQDVHERPLAREAR